jgi:hypothetical protein
MQKTASFYHEKYYQNIATSETFLSYLNTLSLRSQNTNIRKRFLALSIVLAHFRKKTTRNAVAVIVKLIRGNKVSLSWSSEK